MKLIRYIFYISLIGLGYSVIKSGYYFEFDIDELYHVNTTYLIAQGNIPFKDFFLPYSPLFHIFLLPLFSAFGYSLNTIALARVVMIALFIIRIIGIAFVVRMIFGSLAAYLFIPLFLMDPLTEYISMQIRPDNFMLTMYIIGLVFLAKKKIFISGIFFGLSLLISIKIVPSIITVFFVFLMLRLNFQRLFLGFSFPIIFFVLYYLLTGLFIPMMTNIIVDARAINETLKYPIPLGNFYLPTPMTIYGLSFKPVLFQYLWSLPLLAFAGLYNTLFTIKFPIKNFITVILAIALITQWISLFYIRSVFMQYYIPITWLFAVFASVALANIAHTLKQNKLLYRAGLLLLGFIYVYYLIPSIQANSERAKVTGIETKTSIISQWNHVPEKSAVYPGILFRPLAYPVPYGFTYYDLPEHIFTRYKPIEYYLEKNYVKYLNIKDKKWAIPNEKVKQYITSYYVHEASNPLFWKRN